jgi:hypothetical protein
MGTYFNAKLNIQELRKHHILSEMYILLYNWCGTHCVNLKRLFRQETGGQKILKRMHVYLPCKKQTIPRC